MKRFAIEQNLSAFVHKGFLQPMDILREKSIWKSFGVPTRPHERSGNES